MNKKGQGLSVNAIIMIVLGVVVLAVLILGFTMGWNNIAPWLGGGDNVNTIVTACGVACGTQSQYDFCTVQREIKVDSNVLETINNNKKDDAVVNLSITNKYTCNNLLNYPSLGIQDCSNICN